MNKPAFVCLSLLTLLMACNQEKETPSGLKYTVLEAGNGQLPKVGEIVVFDWQMKDSKDSVWKETFSQGLPVPAQIADSSQIENEDGLTQMLRMLSKGDSVSAKLTMKEYFGQGGRPVPPEIDSTLSITFTIAVRNILPEDQFQSYMEEQFKKRELKTFTEDTKEIGEHLTAKNLSAKVDTSGLQYIIHNEAGGRKPSIDDCVEVKYKGTFLETGEVFDQAEHVAFPLNGVIRGWSLGIPLLGIGDSATFYIPSKLAYGPQGYPGAIPPDAILVFDVTLLDVKSEFDQASRTCK